MYETKRDIADIDVIMVKQHFRCGGVHGLSILDIPAEDLTFPYA